MERTNQDLEATLQSLTASNPSSWSTHLPRIEYANNSLINSATGPTHFEASLGFLPPLFPSQENEIAVPLVQMHLCHCRRIWKADTGSFPMNHGHQQVPDWSSSDPCTNLYPKSESLAVYKKYSFKIWLQETLALLHLPLLLNNTSAVKLKWPSTKGVHSLPRFSVETICCQSSMPFSQTLSSC